MPVRIRSGVRNNLIAWRSYFAGTGSQVFTLVFAGSIPVCVTVYRVTWYTSPVDNFEVYVAGFFDGEGSCAVKTYKSKGREYERLVARIAQVDRRVLDQIVEYYGCGQVVEKYDKRAAERGWKICHEVVFTNLSARKLLVSIEPFLIVKKDHVTSCLDQAGRMLTRKNARHDAE